jgi:hypothetical protein
VLPNHALHPPPGSQSNRPFLGGVVMDYILLGGSDSLFAS